MVHFRFCPAIEVALFACVALGHCGAAESPQPREQTVARSPVYLAPLTSPPVPLLTQAALSETPSPARTLFVEPDDVPVAEAEAEAFEAPAERDESPLAAPAHPGAIIDIRQPDSADDSAAQSLQDSPEPTWLNDVADENAALWRENTDTLEIIPNSSGFGLTTLGFASLWKSENTPGVWVVPRFNWTFASGPSTPAVQAQLYDLRLEMNVAQAINEVWTVHLQLAPAFVTDWNNKSSDAFRLIGGGMLAAHVNSELTLLGGALALSRFDLPILPLGGVRWHPNPWLEVDALFPNPRLAWRYKADKDDASHWLYFGGQLGGNQWAVDHATSDHDKLGYRDYRIVIGSESRQRDGNRSLFEIGYVFDRQLKFTNEANNQQPGETIVIRWGNRF